MWLGKIADENFCASILEEINKRSFKQQKRILKTATLIKNEANARTSWTEMQAQHLDLLEGKTMALRAVELGDRGTFVRLIAVPYADSAAARAICRDLRQRAQYCAVLRSE